MKTKLLCTAALASFTIIGVSACGGGGGSSSNTSTNTTATTTTTVTTPVVTPVSTASPVISSSPNASVTEESEANAFYTLEASDPDSADLTMSLVATPDAAAFTFNATTGELSALRALDFEAPLDANDDNIYELTFNVEDPQGNATNFDVDVTVDNIRDATGFGLDPDGLPRDNFELIDWRLDFPRNSDARADRHSRCAERTGIGRRLYEDDEFFFTGADGGLVMRAPVIGATTSSGVRFTRTEFREMLRRGDTSINTNTNSTTNRPNLNNFAFSSQPQDAQDEAGGVDGTLRVTMSVDAMSQPPARIIKLDASLSDKFTPAMMSRFAFITANFPVTREAPSMRSTKLMAEMISPLTSSARLMMIRAIRKMVSCSAKYSAMKLLREVIL